VFRSPLSPHIAYNKRHTAPTHSTKSCSRQENKVEAGHGSDSPAFFEKSQPALVSLRGLPSRCIGSCPTPSTVPHWWDRGMAQAGRAEETTLLTNSPSVNAL